MKHAGSTEKLSGSGASGTSVASKVRSLFSGSPLSRKRTMSWDTLSNNSTDSPASNSSPSDSKKVLGIPLAELVARDGIPVPFIVKKVVHHVEDFGLDQVGIYRINGNVKVIEKLKESFDKVGDANFNGEDIASIAGLLKLFLRELPDGVIPELLMPHFVGIQQQHPSEATPEALQAISYCLKFLPEVNFNSLRFLIRHMAKVADHSSENKMTAVSMSIVFGPNLFHCGSGLEGLKLQGFSNSLVCRMVQNHKTLFPRGQKKEGPGPVKPRPYVEHVASKKSMEKMQEDLSATFNASSSSVQRNPQVGVNDCQADHSYSERSIDEAILETTQRSVSPTSPAKLKRVDSRVVSPLRKSISMGDQAQVNVAGKRLAENEDFGDAMDEILDDEELAGFQRQDAKRRRLKRTKSIPSRKPQPVLDPTMKHLLLRTDDDNALQMRNMSPSSWISSPNTTPPTSPALTPRGTRILNNTIGATVKDLLFQANIEEKKVNSTRKDVYGLLLPDGSNDVNSVSPLPNIVKIKKAPVKSRSVSSTENNSTVTEDSGASDYAVVRRNKKNSVGQKNRKSSVLHETSDDTKESKAATLNETNIRLISVKPQFEESSSDSMEGGMRKDASGGGNVETRVGMVSNLVDQFIKEEEERIIDPTGSSKEREEAKGKISTNTLQKFEKTGKIMGMALPGMTKSSSLPPFKKPVKKSSDASSESTPSGGTPKLPFSISSNLTTSSSAAPSSMSFPSSSITGGYNEVASYARSSTTSEEEVFASPNHNTGSVPVPSSTQRRPLSTTISDDVFVLPPKPVLPTHSVEKQIGELKREGPSLTHPTLSRPKGPKSRKPPGRLVQHLSSRSAKEIDLIKLHSTPNTSTPSMSTNTVPTLPKKSSPPIPPKPKPSKPQKLLKESVNEDDPVIPHSIKTSGTSSVQSSTPQSRENIQPRLDVVAESLETKQAVKNGWTEVGSTSTDLPMERKDQIAKLKEYTHRIRELKQIVREYEAIFQSQHGRKPSNHEKSPIKNKLIELSKLKKTYLALQATVNNDDKILSKTAPPETSQSGSPKTKPTKGDTPKEIDLTKTSMLFDSSLPLQVVLSNIMQSLETRRTTAGRPEQLELMTDSQILQEKQSIQKILLSYERQYGRPQSRSEKETMRPLYDRYRAVKRAFARSSVKDSLTGAVGTQDGPSFNTTDTLPSITLLQGSSELPKELVSMQSGGASKSVIQPDEKSKDSHLPTTKEKQLGQKRQSEVQHKVSDSQAATRGHTPRTTDHKKRPVDLQSRILPEKELYSCSRVELKKQKDLLLVIKADIRKILKKFEANFTEKYGRAVTKQDRNSMEQEYAQYKSIKGKLKLIEILHSKPEPRVTI